MLPIAFAITLHFGSGGAAQSTPRDSWFGADKAKHFLMGAFVQSVGYSGLRGLGVHNGAALAGASAATVAVCLGKELYDRGGRGDPSVKDFTWGIAGGAAATVLLEQTRR